MIIKKPPVVVVLGHIDHGKTTLLDNIRKTNFALKEPGGITQKIGTYEIIFDSEKLTFIDTPGHQAFARLRQRGIKVADLAILVIAADEGVKEQTRESLEYLKAEKIPFVIALTKIDKKEANPSKVINQLEKLNVIPEKFGGDIPIIEVSAIKNKGLDDLLQNLILLRDILDLKVETNKKGRGFILETFKDTRRGILASAIVNEGNVNYGDILVTKTSICKIRIFEDDWGQKINTAYPSKPFLVGNFDTYPEVGEFFEVSDEKNLLTIKQKLQTEEENLRRKLVFEEFSEEDKKIPKILLIIKADNIGSLEALENIFKDIGEKKELDLKIIKTDTGPLNYKDVYLAKDFNAFLISFNIKNDKKILELIRSLNLKLIESNIIYEIEKKFLDYLEKYNQNQTLINDLHQTEIEVLATFSQTKNKKTIGAKVLKGKIHLNQKMIILRNDQKIGEAEIISLEKDKKPATEVKKGEICGLVLQTLKDIKIGDKLKAI